MNSTTTSLNAYSVKKNSSGTEDSVISTDYFLRVLNSSLPGIYPD